MALERGATASATAPAETRSLSVAVSKPKPRPKFDAAVRYLQENPDAREMSLRSLAKIETPQGTISTTYWSDAKNELNKIE